jgi:hypothetical protein
MVLRRREGAMSVKQVHECLRYANECAEQAKLLSELKQRLSLARCCEFSGRLEFLSNVEAKNEQARQIIEDAAA